MGFGKEITDIVRKFIEIRYQLLPYLYTAFWNYINKGTPILKSLVLFDQKDTDAKGATYEQLVELQAYQWMRIEALKTLKLQISIPGSSMTILGPVLNSHTLQIKGIFNTGIYDYDKYFIYSNENYFKDISNYPIFEVYQGKSKIDIKDLSTMIYDTWSDQNQSLAQALATEKNVMFIILFFIILISSFTIISNQIFFIKEKYKDIVLLKSLGISQLQICSLFFVNSFLISIFSIILGTSLGLMLSINIDSIENLLSILLNYDLWNNEIRYLASMPYSIQINDILFIISISIASALIASYIPILRILRIKPNLVLR